MNLNLQNRQQLLGVLAAVAVTLLVGDRVLLTPLGRAWQARADQLNTLRKSHAQGANLLAREKSIRATWDTMRANMLSNDVSAAESQVFRAFDGWSQESRVTITSVKPQWKRVADDFATLECRVEASGNLAALTRFLYEIERDPMALRLQDVDLTTRDDRGEQLALALQVSGLVLNPKPLP